MKITVTDKGIVGFLKKMGRESMRILKQIVAVLKIAGAYVVMGTAAMLAMLLPAVPWIALALAIKILFF